MVRIPFACLLTCEIGHFACLNIILKSNPSFLEDLMKSFNANLQTFVRANKRFSLGLACLPGSNKIIFATELR